MPAHFTGSLLGRPLKNMAHKCQKMDGAVRNAAKIIHYKGIARVLVEIGEELPVLTGASREAVNFALQDLQAELRKVGTQIPGFNTWLEQEAVSLDQTFRKRGTRKPIKGGFDSWTKRRKRFYNKEILLKFDARSGISSRFMAGGSNQYQGKYLYQLVLSIPYLTEMDPMHDVSSQYNPHGDWWIVQQCIHLYKEYVDEELAKLKERIVISLSFSGSDMEGTEVTSEGSAQQSSGPILEGWADPEEMAF